MPTDPVSISDHHIVGIKMLFGSEPNAVVIAKTLKAALPAPAFHSMLYQMEALSDVVQLITVDVDEVVEAMEEKGVVPVDPQHPGVHDNEFKSKLRALMVQMYDSDANSQRKYRAIDNFIDDMLREEVVKDGPEEADTPAEDGAGDSV